MKQLLVLLVLSFLCIAGVAQNINLAFNSVGSGRNITAYYEVEKGDNSYNFGLGYNMNKHALNDDQNQFFRKRLYANNAFQHLNFNFSYQRFILKNTKSIRPFAFYDVQAKHAHTRGTVSFTPSTEQNPTAMDGDGYVYSPDPFTWVEQTIGLGFTADLTERFYLKQRFGVGINLMFADQTANSSNRTAPTWEFGSLLSFGVGMRFSGKS